MSKKQLMRDAVTAMEIYESQVEELTRRGSPLAEAGFKEYPSLEDKKSWSRELLTEVLDTIQLHQEELASLRSSFADTNAAPRPYKEPTEAEAWAEIMADPDLRRDLAGL